MLLGVTGNRAESSAQRWEFGAGMEQGLRITGHGIKESIWLAVMVKSSNFLTASCSFDQVPLGVLRGGSLSYLNSSPCSAFCTVHFVPWTVLWLPCHLSVLFLMSPPQIHLGCWLPRCSHLDVSYKTSPSLKASALECQKKRSSHQLCDSESVSYVALLTCCLGLPSFVTFYSVTYF